MNKIFNPLENIDKFILICVGLLGILSLTMLESTVYEDGFVLARPVLIQAIAYLLGFGVLLFIQNLDYRFFIGLEKILYALSVLFLLTVYIPGLGQENYGSRAWINLGITTLQPSEFVKIPFVLIMAGYLSEHRDELTRFTGVFKAFLVAAPIIAVVLKEDLGSALVYIVMWIFMVFFAGIDYKLFFQCALACLAAVPIVYKFLDDYQKERIEAFLHPENLSLSGNYQVWQSKVAMGSGGFFGKGLFQGTQKSLDFIPVQQSDFIFSVVGEELGFVGCTAVILLLALLLIKTLLIAFKARDTLGTCICFGFFGLIFIQSVVNIGMCLALFPVMGVTLPFFSAGGSSAACLYFGYGLVQAVSMHSMEVEGLDLARRGRRAPALKL